MAQRLAYCGFGVSDVDAWMRFGTDVLGLSPADRGTTRRLRMDERTSRFAVTPSPADDILSFGLERDSVAELAEARHRIEAAGLAVTDLTAEEVAEREVESGFHLTDPDGLRIEFVVGHARSAQPFEARIPGGFVTGDEGFGHIVVSISDLDRGIAFYEKIGFSLSDFITAPVGPHTLRIAFLHCNPRHHSVAMAQMPSKRRLHHFMVEVNEVDEVLLARRRSVAQGHRTGELGRHPNDRMLSFYATTPAGFEVEFGWGGKVVSDDDPVLEYEETSVWGHEPANP